MRSFYEDLSSEDVETLDALSRLLVELRESRLALLARHQVDDEEALLDKIKRGEAPEHPTYEDYLGAKAITVTRETIRAELRDYMLQIRRV